MAATTVITRSVKGSALTHNEMDSNWNNLNNVGIGVGHISMWPTETPPDATWLPCEGQSVLTASYPDLFDVIGYTYGGSGANFNMPDMRAVFPRGWSHGSVLDPDVSSRSNRGDGTTGDHVGTRQLDAYQGHTHPNDTGGLLVLGPHGSGTISDGFTGGWARSDMSSGTGLTSTETRPKNVYVLFIIKALL